MRCGCSILAPQAHPAMGTEGHWHLGDTQSPSTWLDDCTGWWLAHARSGGLLSPPWSFPGPVPSAPRGTAAWAGWGEGKQHGPRGPWLCGRKELTSKGVTLLLYQNRALEQTLVKMPVPWAGLAPCPLPPQQTPEPAYPTSPAFPPLSCPFASRVVYQDGFYGAEIYVSAAPGGSGGGGPGLQPNSRVFTSLPPAPGPHPSRPVLGTRAGKDAQGIGPQEPGHSCAWVVCAHVFSHPQDAG